MHACVPCDNDTDAVLKTWHTGTLTREDGRDTEASLNIKF